MKQSVIRESLDSVLLHPGYNVFSFIARKRFFNGARFSNPQQYADKNVRAPSVYLSVNMMTYKIGHQGCFIALFPPLEVKYAKKEPVYYHTLDRRTREAGGDGTEIYVIV